MNESRADRHQRLKRRAQAAGTLGGGLLLSILAFSPAGAGLSAWARALTASLPEPLAAIAALIVFVTAVVVAWELATLPALLLGGGTRDSGRVSAISESRLSVGTVAAGLVIALPAAVLIAGSIQFSVWLAGAWWWPAAGAFVGAGLILVMHAGPAILARLSGARPVTRPALVERLGALARRISVPIESIDELPPGSSATTTAVVAGGGSARRVFIASDLLQDWSDEEVAFVVAHEMAHHAHHDLWRTLALDTGILVIAFGAADRLASWTSSSLLTPQVGELSALPFVALAVAGVWILTAPLRHAVSRHQERRADDFALRMTGSADAFRTALRRLASRHLAEDHPSRLTKWLYYRHPSVAERLASADDFQARDLGSTWRQP